MNNFIFISLFLFTSFFHSAAQLALPEALQLPALNSIEEQLYLFNGIDQRHPEIFLNNSDYNVDPLALLEDQRKLLDELLLQPGYVEAFKDREYLRISFEAMQDIQTTSVRINPTAVTSWQSMLQKTLHQTITDSNETLKEILETQLEQVRDYLAKKIELDEQSKQYRILLSKIWGADFSSELAPLFQNSKFRKKKNPAVQLKEVGQKIEHILSSVLPGCDYHNWLLTLKTYENVADIKTYALGLQFDPLTENFFRRELSQNKMGADKLSAIQSKLKELLNTFEVKLSKGRREFFESRIVLVKQAEDTLARLNKLENEVKEKEQNSQFLDDKIASLGQLYVIFKQYHPDFATLNMNQLGPLFRQISSLTDEELAFLADPDALIAPLEKFPELKPIVHQAFNHYAQQQRTYTVTLKKGEMLYLEEVPPLVGIFRGLVAGDCSTKHSFPYPNDSNEVEFFVRLGKDAPAHATISATKMRIQHQNTAKTALYIVTIAGKSLRAEDVELIFRGLYEIRNALGVDEIVIPKKENLIGLINHQAIRGIFQQYSAPKSKQESLIYNDQSLRRHIEGFSSKYNDGHYDNMDKNSTGSVLQLSNSDGNDSLLVDYSIARETITAINPVPMGDAELIKFAIHQHALQRYEIVEKVVSLLIQKKLFGIEEIGHFFALVDNRTGFSPTKENVSYLTGVLKDGSLTVEEQKKAVQDILINRQISIGLDELSALLYLGRLQATDAFSSTHLEETAQLIANDVKKTQLRPACGWDFISKHRDQLASTQSYQSVLAKLYAFIQKENQHLAHSAHLYFSLLPNNKPFSEDDRKLLQQYINQELAVASLVDLRMRFFNTDQTKNYPERDEIEKKILASIKKGNFFRQVFPLVTSLYLYDSNEPYIKEIIKNLNIRLKDILTEINKGQLLVTQTDIFQTIQVMRMLKKTPDSSSYHAVTLNLLKQMINFCRSDALNADHLLHVLRDWDDIILLELFAEKLVSDDSFFNKVVADSSLFKLILQASIKHASHQALYSKLKQFVEQEINKYGITSLLHYCENSTNKVRVFDAEILPFAEDILRSILPAADSQNIFNMVIGIARIKDIPPSFFNILMDALIEKQFDLSRCGLSKEIVEDLLTLVITNKGTTQSEKLINELMNSVLNNSNISALSSFLSLDSVTNAWLAPIFEKKLVDEFLENENNRINSGHKWPFFAALLVHFEQGEHLEQKFRDTMDELGEKILRAYSCSVSTPLSFYQGLMLNDSFDLFPKTTLILKERMESVLRFEHFNYYEFEELRGHLIATNASQEKFSELSQKAKACIGKIEHCHYFLLFYNHFKDDLKEDAELREQFQAVLKKLFNEKKHEKRALIERSYYDKDLRAGCIELAPELAPLWPEKRP